MREAVKMVGIMTLFCVAAGFLLAWTNSVTREPIKKAAAAELTAGLKRVLPPCDNDVVADAKKVKDGVEEWTFYVGRKDNAVVGVAFVSRSNKGYGGPIDVLVGIAPDGAVLILEILAAPSETPGLGTKIMEPRFTDQFKAKSAADTQWAAVTKDGGLVVPVTGATISSRAVTAAVKAGLDAFARNRSAVTGP
jgi:electron transport complex protein RnfG